MNRIDKIVLTVGIAGLVAVSAQAEPKLEAPKAALRDLETDRPDATESPVTVDKGHFQFETTFLGFSRNDDAGTRTETLGVMESNLKYGLCNNTDLQLAFTPYVR